MPVPEDVVVDASAMIKVLTENSDGAYELGRRLIGSGLHAPHLLDAEVGDVLRRKVSRGALGEEVAVMGLASLDSLIDMRYPHAGPLSRDAWSLRERVRFYDALYVALAARLDLTLITADARLSRAHGLPCQVEVV
jgi:predicted nucleic acid-binding protein